MTIKIVRISLCIIATAATTLLCADPFYLRTKACPNAVSITVPRPQDHVVPSTNAVAPDAGVKYKLKTEGGITFEATFIDNKRSKIIVLGQTFPAPTRSMRYFIKTLGDAYDYVIFDYRWTKSSEMLWRLNTWVQPSYEILDNSAEEVTSVVDFVRQQKKYDDVIGLGTCYSSYTFLKAQEQAIEDKVPFFTKLILDSCFFSLYTLFETNSRDPYFTPTEKTGWARRTLHNMLQKEFVHSVITNIMYWITPHISSVSSLQKINAIPLLFIHGKDESIVKPEHFEELWKAAANIESAAVLTPFEHVRNINNNKAAYTYIVNTFINNDFDTFTRTMLQGPAQDSGQPEENNQGSRLE
jgi:hypothetical protein